MLIPIIIFRVFFVLNMTDVIINIIIIIIIIIQIFSASCYMFYDIALALYALQKLKPSTVRFHISCMIATNRTSTCPAVQGCQMCRCLNRLSVVIHREHINFDCQDIQLIENNMV